VCRLVCVARAQANQEKQRLEKKQRKARKEAEEGVPIHPRWFDAVEGAKRGDQLSYVYNGEYWQQRERGKFTGCRDIFGPEESTAPAER
jgi:oxysterol-binding protein 1